LRLLYREGSNTINELDTALYDEDVLSDELPDMALELAGANVGRDPRVPSRFHFAQG
jgi:hypothetical protein